MIHDTVQVEMGWTPKLAVERVGLMWRERVQRIPQDHDEWNQTLKEQNRWKAKEIEQVRYGRALEDDSELVSDEFFEKVIRTVFGQGLI